MSENINDVVTVTHDRPTTLFGSIKEALRGSHADFTEGPIGQAVLLLAIPMVLEVALEGVFAVTDVFFVSKLGPDAVATVGLTESILTLIYALAMGLGIGATALVARRIGEKNPEAASHSAVQAIVIGIIMAATLGVTGATFAPKLLMIMGAEEGVLKNVTYTRVILGGDAVVILLFLINAIFRGAGDAAIAMRVLWLANSLNIILGPLLIFGIGPFPKLGVVGAAVATTVGRGVGAMFALSRLFSEKGRVRIHRRHLRLDPVLMWKIIRLSASGTFQVFVGMASWIGLIRIISSFGSSALAGYTIGIRVIIFALMPSWGMSNAAATMVGQALGANKPERAERAVWRAGLYNMCFLGLIGLGFVLFARQIVSFFTTDPEVTEYAVDCLRIVSYGFLFYANGMVLTQAFNGAGDTMTPTIINLLAFWLLEIPLGYVLAKTLSFGPRGVFVSIAVSFSFLAVISAIWFKRGKWKERKV